LTVGTPISQGVDVRLAGNPKRWFREPSNINMRLPDQVLNTVCFFSHPSPTPQYGGTGFIVSMAGTHGNAFLHLVTAKHVAEAVEGAPFLIGLNSKDGKKAVLEANYDQDRPIKWWYHPTEPDAVDAAVTLFTPPDYEDLAVEWVHYPQMFATPERMKQVGIGIGDEIAVIGLFTAFSGKDHHYPIARIGNLAMIPNERIPVKGFNPMEAYLAEGRSIGGLSGSPVYVRRTIQINVQGPEGDVVPFSGTSQIYFLGLMHGHWDLPKGFVSTVKGEAINMGISIIVPAQKIMEILMHPELVEMRRQYDEAIGNENLPTPDSALRKPKSEKVFTRADFESALTKASRKVKPPVVRNG
jgi:hypothetical protein